MTLRIHPTEIVRQSQSPLLAVHASWARVPLGDIAEVKNGFAFKSQFFNKTDGMPLLRIRDVGRGLTETRYSGAYDPAYIVRHGDIVVGMDGDFRVARWRGPEALLNQRVCKVVVRDQNFYDEDFLLHALPGYLNAIHDHTSSVTVKHLSSESLKEIPLPLPPLSEQRRIIVAIEEQFSRIDAGVEALHRARRNLQRIRAAVLQAAVTGRLVPLGRNDEPAEKLVKRLGASPATGPEIPFGWCWVRLGDVAIVGSGATPLRSRRDYYEGGTIPWVTSSMLNAEFVDRPSEFITEKALRETSVKLWPPHTLLVAMYGEGQTRGKCSELLIEATTNQACAAILLEGEATALRPFVKLHFAANYEANRRLASGGVQPNLSLGLVKSQLIALPPLSEQQRTLAEVDRQLSIARAMEGAVVRNYRRGNHLRQAILARAFSGRLVPQDPLDEPASVIIDRIKRSRNGNQSSLNPSLGRSRR